MLTLREIVQVSEFGLEFVAGGDQQGHRPVAGAHSLEQVADPLQWVPEDWIMLTNGIQLRQPREQKRLVETLDGGGVCALGFGVGFGFRSVPQALLREADKRQFPVFAVPRLTAFRDIVRFIDTRLLTSDLHTLRRAFSMHGYLLDALAEANPEQALGARLAKVLSADVAIFRPDGTAVSSTNVHHDQEWWRRLTAARTARTNTQELVDDGDGLLALPVTGPGGLQRWVVVLNSDRSLKRPITSRILASAGPILRAVHHAHRLSDAESQAVRAGLLQELLEPAPVASRPRADLTPRALACGVDLAQTARVAVVRPAPAGPDHSRPSGGTRAIGVRPLADAIGAVLTVAAVPHLTMAYGDGAAVLVQGNPDLEPVIVSLRERGYAVVCGVGRAVEDVDGIPVSLRDAEISLTHNRGDGGPTTAVARYEDLDLAHWLVAEIGQDRVREKAAGVLAPLVGRPEMLETLSEYLRQAMNVPATARALHVHQNSLRYRLTRIEQLLGRRLRDAADVAAIHIALLTTPELDSASTTPGSASSSASV